MKNYVMKNYIKNRNSLRYLITNPFTEPFSYTLLKFFKDNKYLIVDKDERVSPEESTIKFKIKRYQKVILISAHVSKDHLITISLTNGKNSAHKKTRSIEECLLFIQENIE